MLYGSSWQFVPEVFEVSTCFNQGWEGSEEYVGVLDSSRASRSTALRIVVAETVGH